LASCGNLIVEGNNNTSIQIWNYITGTCSLTINTNCILPCKHLIQINTSHIATNCNDKKIFVWDFKTGDCLNIIELNYIIKLLIRLNDEQLLCHLANSIIIIEIKTGNILYTMSLIFVDFFLKLSSKRFVCEHLNYDLAIYEITSKETTREIVKRSLKETVKKSVKEEEIECKCINTIIGGLDYKVLYLIKLSNNFLAGVSKFSSIYIFDITKKSNHRINSIKVTNMYSYKLSFLIKLTKESLLCGYFKRFKIDIDDNDTNKVIILDKESGENHLRTSKFKNDISIVIKINKNQVACINKKYNSIDIWTF